MIDPFKYVAPTEKTIPRFEKIADVMAHAYNVIKKNVPEGRERSLAITKLQEARMWANAGISFGDDDALEKE